MNVENNTDWYLFPVSINFPGDRWIHILNRPEINLTHELTMMAWIYCLKPGDQRIFCKNQAGYDINGYGLDTHEDRLRFIGTQPAGLSCFSSTSKLNAIGNWKHVACTFTREKFKLFINGKLDSETTPTDFLHPNNFPLMLGTSPVGLPYSGHFMGRMCQISLWNIALKDEQVNEYKDKWLLHNPTGLVLYYPCLTVSDTEVTDFSGNNIHGKIVGSARNPCVIPVPTLPPLLWSKSTHRFFPLKFRRAVNTLLMLSLRDSQSLPIFPEWYFWRIPKEILEQIFFYMSVPTLVQ